MNDLAWFFYWANIIPNIGVVAAVFSFLLFIVFGAIIVTAWGLTFGSYKYYEKVKHLYGDERRTEFIKDNKPISIWVPLVITFVLFIVWLGVVAVAVLTPSEATIYKMGGSVAAEYIIELEEVQEIGGELSDLAKDTIQMIRSQIPTTRE